MKDSQFNAQLALVRPVHYVVADPDFTDRVMKSIASPEILSTQIRKMSVNKKETPFMKLRHLPKLAVVAIALGALVIISGSAYAAYKLLWPKPEVRVSQSTTSASGRQEVVLSFSDCDKKDVATHYELKKGAPITADEIPMVVQAHCELDAIGTWAQTTFPNDDADGRFPGGSAINPQPYNRTMLSTNMATTLKAEDASNVTFTGLTKYNQQDTTFVLSDSVRYIVDGHDANASDIKAGDLVTYVTSETSHLVPNSNCTETSCSYSGSASTTTLLAIVKLDMPAQYYDQLAWQSLTEVDSCTGNPNDNCLTGYSGSIDLYGPGGSGQSTGITKEIQGTITAINGVTFTIQSSSGSLFTITAPSDIIASYNNKKAAQYYNNQFVTVGKSLDIMYVEPADQQEKTIKATQLQHVSLMIELISKGDPVKAY